MDRNDVLMISFSGGRSSAYMTDRLLREGWKGEVVICFANTGKEAAETLDFVHACELSWQRKVHWLEYDLVTRFREVEYETASRKGEPFAALIDKRKYLPNVVWRFCTQDLKVRVIKRFMMSLGYKHWINAIGIRYDEPARWSKTRAIGERERWETWLPLVDWRITKPIVLDFWRTMPFDLQLEHYQGNCDLCFLKGRNKMRRLLLEDPALGDWWMEQEDKTGATFRKGLSVRRFVELIRASPSLFEYEDADIECFCNVD
ncbi:MAG TPA: phosphoadenosine phosphosulfate reductase family protein [Puia sp.]|nr:phosphoadenosine phosphosulfate reductase family protein [Puia sp.]